MLFAIYRNNEHISNVRAADETKAAKIYIKDAGLSEEFFEKNYNVRIAIRGVHF